MTRLTLRHIVLLFAFCAVAFLLASPVSAASTILVDTTTDVVADDGLCSLREAIYAANTGASFSNCTVGSAPHTIEFAPALPTPAIFTLTLSGAGENAGLTGDLDLTGAFSVAGVGANSTIIDGNGADRVLHVHSTANVTISGVTLRNGNPGATASGGGIAVENSGRLRLNNSIVSNNQAAVGAGLLNTGATSNTTIENSRISFNIATADGGGISNYGILDLKSSTIDNNQAKTGGGIDHQGLSFKAQNSTISGNTASDNGGGISNQKSATLTNVTLTDNSASGPGTGGNLFNDGDAPQIIFVNTIVANPGPGGNCVNTVGALNSGGHNLESTNTCNFNAAGDQINTNPLLGPLQDNGGPTPTHALLSGSPAIDQGDDTKCPADDQRGVARPVGPGCDIGAVEANGTIYGVSLSPDQAQSAKPGQSATYTVIVKNTGNTADTFNLSLSGSNWPTNLSHTNVDLGPGQSTPVKVIVNLPPDVTNKATDVVRVTATSQADSSKSAITNLTTTSLISLTIYLPICLQTGV